MNWTISPGSMGVVSIAIKCLGIENVNPGGWGTPVYVTCSQEDALALQDILNEIGVPTNTTFTATPS